MATKHTNWMKATIWRPTVKTEIEGTPDGIIPMAFFSLDTPERRAKCIAKLQEIDKQMSEKTA